MSDNSDFLVRETLRLAYVPDTVSYPEDVVGKAVEIFADLLSERGAKDFGRWIGGDLGERAGARTDKIEHSMEEMIQLLAKETGVSPQIADDVLVTMFEVLWRFLDRSQLDDLIAQAPADTARELMAAIPGEARGKF